MENNFQRSNRAVLKQRRSGYEPSDAETEWQDSPQGDENHKNGVLDSTPEIEIELPRKVSPLKIGRRHTTKFTDSSPKKDSEDSPVRRRHNGKSPYKPRRDDGSLISPLPTRRNISPLPRNDNGRQASPYKYGREDSRRKNRMERTSSSQFGEVSRQSERSTHSRRSATAPRTRGREQEQENGYFQGLREQKGARNMVQKQKEREGSHLKVPSGGELNEIVANMKMSTGHGFDSTDSISPGDIFFSRDHAAFSMQKNGNHGVNLYPKPTMFSQMNTVLNLQSTVNGNGSAVNNPPKTPSSASRTTMTSSSAVSRQSSASSKMSDNSGLSGNLKKFTANRRKSQAEGWFSCMRRGPCRTSRSPERQHHFDEASYIEKAFVVESLRPFWADKYQPGSLNGFTCHREEAQLLRQLISHDSIPHFVFKGPSGSGKKALAMALLGEIFGNACRNMSHDLRYFQVQDKRATQVLVPVTSSAHHVELNVNTEPNAKYALMGLVKEISNTYAITPEVSNINFKPDYKVIVLYEVDKAVENTQHLIKWIMDCYTDACKLILCCEDDVNILDSVKNRCKVIEVEAPPTNEIVEILMQIARKEDFNLTTGFAMKIAMKSKQNVRKAIMALEACKAHNYPFVDDQPVPVGWEEVLIELAAEILADPSSKRLFLVRGKFQKLLVDFVHPKLILLKLVEQFLKGVAANSKREIYYWHGYYDKRLPTGTTALLKLEEFVAKFMSIHRKSFGGQQYV